MTPANNGSDELHRVFNEKNQAVRFEYFLNGEPVTVKAGYTIMTREYNDAGKISTEAYFDVADHPVLCTNGYAFLTREYDEKGNMTLESYFDAEGKPAKCQKGYYAIAREYDEKGKVTQETMIETLEGEEE